MIAELFYPRELKEIITDLRAKGDLNEEAKKNINCFFYKCVALEFFGSLILSVIFLNQDFAFIVLFFCILFFGFIYFDFQKYIERKIFPYLSNSRKNLKILRMKSYRGGAVLVCEDSDKKIYRSPLLRELWRLKNLNEGFVIACFISKLDPKIFMPDEESIKRKFCLSKSILKGKMS